MSIGEWGGLFASDAGGSSGFEIGVSISHQVIYSFMHVRRNLLLDQHRNVKITDFGFANYDCSVQREQFLRTSCGSPCYAAPELVLGDGYKGAAADIWSCGVILYAMLCGFLPFDDDPENPDSSNVNKLYQYIMSTALTFPAHVPSLAQELILKMLNPNPEERYSMSEIYTHPWVADTFRQQQLLRSTPPPSVSMENEEEQDDENKENDSVSNRDSRSMSVPAVTPFTAPAKSRPPALHIKTDPILPNFLNRTSPYRPRAGSTPISGGEPAMITPNAQIPSATSSDSQTTASSTAIQSAGRHSLPPEKNGASMWKLFTKRHHQKAGTSTSVLPLHTPDAAFTTSFDAPCDRSSDDGARSSHELNIHRGALNQDLVSSVLTPYEMLSIVQDILMAAPTVSLSVSASSPTQLQPPERVHRRRQSGSLSSLNFMTNPPFYEGGMSESPVSSSFFCNGRVTMERSGDYEWTVTWVPLHPTATRSHHSSHEELRAMDMEMGKHGNSFGDRVRRSWHELRRSFAQLSLGGSMKQSDVKFTVEVCRLQNLPGVFCLNFKRLRGDLWQYKRIYKLCSEQFCNITNEKPVRQN